MNKHVSRTFKKAIVALSMIALFTNASAAFAATEVGTNITTAGSIGIGTTSPTSPLHVIGAGLFDFTGTSTGSFTIGTPLGYGPGAIALSPSGDRRDIRFTDTGMTFLVSTTSSSPGTSDGMVITDTHLVGIGQSAPTAKLEVEVTDADNVSGILIDNNDVTNDTPGLHIQMAENGGFPLVIGPVSARPTAAEGGLYFDSDDDNLYFYDGVGWVDLTGGGGGGMSALLDDTTPQLGGNLDINGFSIVGASALELLKFNEIGSAVNEVTITNAATGTGPIISATGGDTDINLAIDAKADGDVILSSSGTGHVAIGGDGKSGLLELYSEQATDRHLYFQPYAAMTQDVTYTFPADDGAASQVLSTDGSGGLSWATIMSSSLTDNTTDALDFQEGTNNYININTTNLSEAITFGNATTNPSFSFLGTGDFVVNTDDLYVDTTTSYVGINTTSPGVSLDVRGSAVFNEDGGTELFRVEGDTNADLFFVDGLNDRVGIGTGTPSVKLDVNGDIRALAQGDVRFADSDSSNYVAFQSPAIVSSNVTWTLPSADGTSGYLLSTNGSGTLSWASAGTNYWGRSGTILTVATSGDDIRLGDDDELLIFGDNDDIQFVYDETTDNRLEVSDGTNLLMSLTDAGTTGNLAVSGDLAVNGGDITSSGALTITPYTGTNLNVTLSGAGDLAVNTDDLYVDTSTGYVGIGTASPTAAKLVVAQTDAANLSALTLDTEETTGSQTVFSILSDSSADETEIFSVAANGASTIDFGTTGSLVIGTPGGMGPGFIGLSPDGSRRDVRFENGGLAFRISSDGSGPSGYSLFIEETNGYVGIGGETSPTSALHVPDGQYAQFEDNNAGAPGSGCTLASELGRISIDTTNSRLYVCMGASGWKYATLN